MKRGPAREELIDEKKCLKIILSKATRPTALIFGM